ncbi:MAG: DEAD/DEAH box helicase family protein [bacterium]|nr:DEAD/DEAH box helicase family protein [bacterium]
MHPLDEILDDWRRKASEPFFNQNRAQGTAFENLCKAFLTHDPVQSRQFQNIQTYAEWAHKRGFPESEAGVDLVAALRDDPGYFAAIQCKFLKQGGTILKKEVDTFLSWSGRKDFRRRVWIDTTGRPWSRNVEETLRFQDKPVQRIGLHYLKASPIDWAAYVTSGDIGEREPPKIPYPHQQRAIDNALAHFASPGTRGKILMACGTGKTLVGLRIAEQAAGKNGRVLVLVPSLALLSQTLKAWFDDALVPIRAFAVCSDSQTGRPRRSNGDTADMDVLDLAYPATTDAARLGARALPDTPDAMTVVFATYQSSEIISQAQLDHELPAFDLAIADEAHRTAGALIPGEDPSPFVRIHDDDAIRASRRLYMTATPKVYAASARNRAGELAATLCSMDDDEQYGPVLHETRFGDAVDGDLLSDYRVIVLTVPESLAANIRIREFSDGEPLTLDERGKMIGCLRALAKTDAEQFPEEDRLPMRRAIAFCNLVKSSERLESRIHEVAEANAELIGIGDCLAVSARHVDGTFNATRRGDALEFLEDAPEGEMRILTNARCLTEGVDVPALDGILFMHPRKSQIEVVQAVGRVMRKVEGKKLGYVVLPVVVPSAASPEQALADDKRWQTVWQMLNAIRSHDERFEGMLNRLEMGEAGDRISIITLADWHPSSSGTSEDDRPAADPDTPPMTQQYRMVYEGLPEAIRTRIVEKCGNRRYWEDWAGDVARIARAHIKRITEIIDSGDAEREILQDFLTELRDDLNPEISEDDAIEMLAQHMVTRPVFDALFGEAAAARRNPVGQGMQTVLDVLEPARIDVEAESLDPFYDSVRRRVQGASSAEARQRIVVELYDKFFRKAFPKVTERLGIVYTPIEVVDFILHSVQGVLADEFGSSLGEPGVHILDPFTGTGTFITRLMQSGLLSPEQIVRKFGSDGQTPELHANEIVLLAYYIASVNIETAFQGATHGSYQPFDGICLTDTFALTEHQEQFQALFADNSERRTRQRALDIRVIVGNPPWSAKQQSSSDANPNASYPRLERRIADTYAMRSRATNKNSLYDTYKLAIRWASDRIGECGVVAFVTNGSWIDGNVDSGVRACLAEEFNSIHVFNLRGNQRTQGERSRREGGKIFGQGSRAPVSIVILVRTPDADHDGCRILYRDIGDYLTRERKLEILSEAGSIIGIDDWQRIKPNRHHDWVSQRDDAFYALYPMGSKRAKAGKSDDAIFLQYSRGLETARDAYIYNYSSVTCAQVAKRMVKNYSNVLREWRGAARNSLELEDIIERHSSSAIKWDDQLKDNLCREKVITYSNDRVWTAQYRPFVKQRCYTEYLLVKRKSQQDTFFPTAGTRNHTICVPGIGSTKAFSVLMVNYMPDLNFESAGCQCFPRHRFEPLGASKALPGMDAAPERIDNITDAALKRFRTHYRDCAISKDDIFDYVYGVLHAPDYRSRFASDLSKSLPRIPMATDFRTFAAAGRELARLHLGYEDGPEYPLKTALAEMSGPIFGSSAMRFAGDGNSILVINDHLRLCGIPHDAHRYEVNGRTPLGWFIDRYRVTTDKRSGITNDPNAWFSDHVSFVTAVRRIVHLSVETVRIVNTLPAALHE